MASSAENNFRSFTRHLEGLIRDCDRRIDTRDIAEINVFIERIFALTTKATKLQKACPSLPANDDFRVAISDVAGELRARLKQWNGKRQHALPKPKRVESFHPAGNVEREGPGRPRKDISVEDVLHDILDLDYSVTDVAKKHQVNRSTIYRRLDEHGLNIQQERYTDISQQEIEEIVERARVDYGFREMGQKVMFGHLR
ncbi:PREDICTED: uncharacterized protein LOC109479615 [Branchiostoma belcheri]|uniref:Uncharacterized protein LOC109479615 n=1 Tax=Branchiostoma belcheri TaxID=7741 RepID=A0A6P5A5V9_BRABE|nr:PREDICTED: uncharacterized protein LOC109479615 [Branchiostoma belcheri]